MIGRVVKAVGGKFFVKPENCAIEIDDALMCDGRGKIKQNLEIIPGDLVEVFKNSGQHIIERVILRKNCLIRPPVANVDQIIIVIAPLPEPDMILVDKMLIMARQLDIKSIFCVNKRDLSDSGNIYDNINDVYSKIVDKTIFISSLTGEGVEELNEILKNNISCFCGQSAVGKSSLINSLTGLDLETGGLAQKINRGKHTTRHAALISVCGGYIVDTPGFSLLNLGNIRCEDLYMYYDDYMVYQNDCKYKSCTHTTEPDCAVKSVIEQGRLDKSRHQRYLYIFNELKKGFLY